MKLVVIFTAVLCVGFISSDLAWADVSVMEGYIVRTLAQLPVTPQPTSWMALALAPPGSSFGSNLYVSFSEFSYGPPGGPPDDFMFTIDPSGVVLPFLEFPETETDPIDICFAPGNEFGSNLFVSANNMDNYQSGDQGGALLEVQADGNIMVFFPNEYLISEPRQIEFCLPIADSFSQDLYVANSSNPPNGVFSVTADGIPGSYSLNNHCEGVVFASGDRFGTDLYLGAWDGHIYRADREGVATIFSGYLGDPVGFLHFSDGGAFGSFLYALTFGGKIVRIDSSGAAITFLTGLPIQITSNNVTWNDLEFSLDGNQLYVTDAYNAIVYVVELDCNGNGISDQVDIASHAPGHADFNNDGILDICQPGVSGVENRDVQVHGTILHDPYPNPFNPQTTIAFDMPNQEPVRLAVYDVSGRLVDVMLDGDIAAQGRNEIVWRGRDLAGRVVSAGVYFYRLEAGSYSETKRMVLVK